MAEAHAESESDDALFAVTETAAHMIDEVMEQEGKEDAGLRVGIVPGGCSGYSYALDFVEGPREQDHVIEEHGVEVYIGEDVVEFVEGATLDFEKSVNGAGFVLDNPNAESSCGCGKSFS